MKIFEKMQSFRLRIALLSVVLSAIVLVTFATFTFALIQRMNLRRVDENIREFSHRHLVQRSGQEEWERAANALGFFIGDQEENAFIMLVKDADDKVDYVTSNWPQELSHDQFFFPNSLDYPRPPSRPEFRRQGPPGEPPGREMDGRASDANAPDNQRFDGPPGMRGRGPQGMRPPRHENEGDSDDQNFRPAGPEGRPNLPPRMRNRPGQAFGNGPPDNMQQLGNPPQFGEPHPQGPQHGSMPTRSSEFSTYKYGSEEWRVGMMGNPEVTLVLGFNLRQMNTEMAQVRNAFLTAIPFALLFIAAGAWWLSQRALKPVTTLTDTVEQITAHGLDQRIPFKNEAPEFQRLVNVFNEMMDRLEASFNQALRFSADAAHELKTPLTILQGQLEQAVHDAQPGSDEQRRYSVLAKEVQRLKSIIRKLLLLSRVDAGELKLNLRPINLSDAIEAVAEDAEILAPQLKIKSDLPSDLWVMADSDLMRQVIQNLTTNAIKYNQKGGFISLKLRATDELVRFIVTNSGREIPAEDRQRIFDRFFRVDKAHRRHKIDGVGLGLTIAKEILRAHRGELRLENTVPGTTAFSVTLPKASPLAN
ncbi:ATP-binding protein [Candidatus Hydrogenedentota bacterium]